MTVGVVTDSAATLPADIAEKHMIEVVPMYLTLGGTTYRDGTEMPPADFYQRLAHGDPASTSGATTADFQSAFERVLSGGCTGVVCVTVASFVSVTFTSASIAARDFDGRVAVVDSGSASMGQGFVALEAARRAADGATVAAVSERASQVAGRTHLVAAIDSFEYLKRSGRVNALAAYAGTALGIRPVFAFRGGKVEQVGRPRSRAKAMDLVEREVAAAGRGLHVAVCHAAVPEDARVLLERIEQACSPVESMISECTPLMGAHTGPGLIGAAYYAS